MPRYIESNLMPLAATAVVLVYAAGVIARRSMAWYEWLAAAAGLGFSIWFWIAEWKRAQRRKGK